MRVYLDTCCLNRPFDLSDEARVLLEAEAVLAILERCIRGSWTWIGSEVLIFELAANRKKPIRDTLLDLATSFAVLTPLTSEVSRRAEALARYGMKVMDAQHVACAETADADVFLTTDDRLLKAAAYAGSELRVHVANPAAWLNGVLE
jgi:predicted nucleic acid-binding protein